MTSQAVTVVNQLGMHARAAAKFVHLATRFEARVKVARDRREMDGKSIMGILLLAAACGSSITISAEGGGGKRAQPVARHCRRIRAYEPRHKPYLASRLPYLMSGS